MRQVLTENAFEAWAAAIRFCDDIQNGKATLQYQKNFVSSLHNAVELIMKQMLLNNNEHSVANIKNVRTKADAKLLYNYFNANDLNDFFNKLSANELSKFITIQFSELIELHKKIFGKSLAQTESLKPELKLLQQLRNNETHFLIRQGSFLSEKDFCALHNFMIKFYKIMESWYPVDKDDYELYILPYWGDPIGADSIYGFDRKPLKSFSYEKAVKKSPLANKVADILNEDQSYGTPDFSPYDITKQLIEDHPELSAEFDDIWSIIYMMQGLGMLVIDEILDEEQEKVFSKINVLI